MVTLLALCAALSYGTADFLGGAASRRAQSALRVLLISVPAGLVALVVASLLAGGSPTFGGLAWGTASGVAGGAGLITFYRALAQGPMSVVAPVSALAAAILPVAVGLARGERLDLRVLIGVVLCMAAIGLVSMEENKPAIPDKDGTAPSSPATRGARMLASGPFMAAISGAAFGIFFVLLHQAGGDSGLWPTAASRSGGLVIVLIAVLVVYLRRDRTAAQQAPRLPLGAATVTLAVLSGLLDGAANVTYFISARDGVLSIAAVLTSLYPAVTVLFARLVYSERLRVIQRVGMAVAVAGVALVTVG